MGMTDSAAFIQSAKERTERAAQNERPSLAPSFLDSSQEGIRKIPPASSPAVLRR
jgi:hypothetical protein